MWRNTQKHRVLIFNQIPTANAAARRDVVARTAEISRPSSRPDLTQQQNDVTAKLLLNPVAVSSDGVRLFVTDLG